MRFFRFSAVAGTAREAAGRQSDSSRSAGQDSNNKEVPLDARESHFEMQRVQAEKLQHHEEQEEQNTPDKLELNKYCPFCKKHTLHTETK